MGTSRKATDAEVDTWRKNGWVLLDGLVGTEEIDALAEDLGRLFPAADDLHADPDGVTEQWLGRPVKPKEAYVWPDEGPGFRPDQQRWSAVFPFPGHRSAEPHLRASIHRRLRRAGARQR